MSKPFKQNLINAKGDMIRFHVIPPIKNSTYAAMATITQTDVNGGSSSRKVPVEQARGTWQLYTKLYGYKPTERKLS